MDKQNPNSLIEYIDILEQEGIPKDEHWRYVGQFLERKSRRLYLPVHGNFELTPLCNFDCKMCYIHLSGTQYEEHHLLHSIADGSGAQKYCVAKSEEEQHVHITCNICHHTYCCKSLLVPKVEVPEGFQVIETSYVIKGICGECSKKISKYGNDGRQ